MRHTATRIGLLTGTLVWIGLTLFVLFSGNNRGLRGQALPEEPRQARQRVGGPLLKRISERTGSRLFDPGSEETVAEALARLGVPAWHRAGWKGQGIKIAILDSGFQGYHKALGSALPGTVQTRSFRQDRNLEARESQHGILCGEILHRLAPSAELLLANWEPDQPEQFLEAVRWARREGAHIISCSLIMPTWSDGEGGGKVHAALREALGSGDHPGDGLFFASAGNTAQRHWGGLVRPGRDGWHEWVTGHSENVLHPLGRERVSVELSGPGEAPFEVVVRDALLRTEIGKAVSEPTRGSNVAAVRFEPKWGHRYTVRLRPVASPGPSRRSPKVPFHLVVLGGRLQYSTPQSSIPFPGDGPEVVAVGAVDSTGQRLSYSSCGPNSSVPKPELVATVPFPSLWRAEQPFAGTSAASPQAAALAALIWSRHPDWNAGRVRQTLLQGARALGEKKHDPETGFGQVRLP
jgi:subtilisin family serine protease